MAAIACAVAVVTAVAAQRAQGKRTNLLPTIWRLVTAFVLGALLSAWYVAPALLESRYVAIGQEGANGYTQHFATWSNLFVWRFPYPYPSAADPTVPLSAWLVIPALGAIVLFFQRRKGISGTRVAATVVAVTLSLLLVSLWLTTAGSAWLWRLLAPILSRLQFPWRWQAIMALTVAVALALLAHTLLKGRSRAVVRVAAFSATTVVAMYTLGAAPWPARDAAPVDVSRAAMWAFDAAQGQVGATWTAEFLPRWVTEQRWAIGREPSDSAKLLPEGPVAATATLVDDGYLRTTYALDSPAEFDLRFNRFYYPAWSVRVDGARVAKQPVSSMGLLAARVAAGARTVAVQWSATPAVWLGRILTLLGWLAGLLLILRLNAARTWALIGWAALAILLLAGSSGITARSLPVQPSSADFGPVQLAGMAASPARAGSEAALNLHWFVQEQSGDLTTFIHLLAADGTILTQVDAPLAGQYTPAARLAPGMLVRVTQLLPIPANLAPGTYALRLGLYPAGEPEQPLQPAGGGAPYVTTLDIEVLP
jgi:hypothetical protein